MESKLHSIHQQKCKDKAGEGKLVSLQGRSTFHTLTLAVISGLVIARQPLSKGKIYIETYFLIYPWQQIHSACDTKCVLTLYTLRVLFPHVFLLSIVGRESTCSYSKKTHESVKNIDNDLILQ